MPSASTHGGGEQPIRVLIVDDELMFAQALSVMIEGAGHAVVAVVSGPDDALAALREHEADLVLLDMGLPGVDGTGVARAILDARPRIKVAGLTVHADGPTQHAAIEAGFLGYLAKDLPGASFVEALRRISRGEPLGGSLGRPASGNGAPARSPEQLLAARLSQRETQVLELIAAGTSSRAIARRLGISPNTVRSHINAILSKLQLRSSLEAAAFAVRIGLVR